MTDTLHKEAGMEVLERTTVCRISALCDLALAGLALNTAISNLLGVSSSFNRLRLFLFALP